MIRLICSGMSITTFIFLGAESLWPLWMLGQLRDTRLVVNWSFRLSVHERQVQWLSTIPKCPVWNKQEIAPMERWERHEAVLVPENERSTIFGYAIRCLYWKQETIVNAIQPNCSTILTDELTPLSSCWQICFLPRFFGSELKGQKCGLVNG